MEELLAATDIKESGGREGESMGCGTRARTGEPLLVSEARGVIGLLEVCASATTVMHNRQNATQAINSHMEDRPTAGAVRHMIEAAGLEQVVVIFCDGWSKWGGGLEQVGGGR